MDSALFGKIRELAKPGNRRIVVCSAIIDTALIQQLIEAFKAEGIRCDAIGGLSTKSYRRAGIFWRIWARFAIYVLYPIKLGAFGAVSRSVIFIATTNPFFSPAILVFFKQRSSRLITWMFDIYPECLVVHGSTSRDSQLYKVILLIMRFSIAKSDCVVYLGKRLRDFGVEVFGGGDRSVTIPIGSGLENAPLSASPQAAECVLSYTGNIGRLHDTETLIAAIKCIPSGSSHRLKFVFAGGGYGFQKLKSSLADFTHPNVAVEFRQNLTDHEWVALLKGSHIAISTMRKGAERVLIPSKTFSSLSAGQAVLAVAPANSDLADLVRESNCGWVFEPGDVAGLAKVFQMISENPRELIEHQRCALAAASTFEFQNLRQKWLDVELKK